MRIKIILLTDFIIFCLLLLSFVVFAVVWWQWQSSWMYCSMTVHESEQRRSIQNDCTITNPVVNRPILSSLRWRYRFVVKMSLWTACSISRWLQWTLYQIPNWPASLPSLAELQAAGTVPGSGGSSIDRYFAEPLLYGWWLDLARSQSSDILLAGIDWLLFPKWEYLVGMDASSWSLRLEELQMINTPGVYWRLSLARHDAVATGAAAAPWRRIFHSLPK